ncbi:hypothetical protein JHD50_03785, partial [Sulfurimonas sp. MAG313]
MHKLLIFSLLSLLFFTSCGDNASPKPELTQREQMMLNLQSAHEDRFRRDGSHHKESRKNKSGKKRLDNPSAYIYKSRVLSPNEEKKWIKENISNTEYPKWAKLRLSAKEVTAWKKLSLSYPAISAFNKLHYTHQKANKFINKKFFTRPVFYAQFGNPVYEFDTICRSVISQKSPPFAYLEDKCLPYMKASHTNEAIGHLIDEAKINKGPLALEYLAELRNLVSKNSRIQSGMEVTLEEFVDDEDTKNFVFLFPLLKSEPSQVEMDFIDAHKLPLQESERFFSFQNPQYWIHRAESLAAAEEEAARQEALLRAKKASERKKAALRLAKAKAFAKEKLRKEKEYRQKQYKAKVEQSRRKKALTQCGKYISSDQYSGREALLEGNV